jgi:hypothetical protein
MLSGVAFTGRRNDKRRGFNAHRGNRIWLSFIRM